MQSFIEFGKEVKEKRKARRWSQSRLADRVGSTRETIWAIETGCVSPTGIRKCSLKFDLVLALANKLDIDLNRFKTI